MGKVTIAFCDENQVYVRRFAVFFRRTRGRKAEILAFSDRDAFAESREKEGCPVWVLGEGFEDCADLASEKNQVMFLVEQEAAECGPVQICKYQQARGVIDRILSAGTVFGQTGHGLLTGRGKDVELLAVISPAKHPLLTPFGVALSEYLARDKRVLYVNLSDCSGISGWLGITGEHDVTDLLYLCTRDQSFSGSQIRQAVFREGEVDYLVPAVNPMLLYEAQEADYERLLSGLLADASYDALVVELGIMHQGFFYLLEQCDTVFCLRESGAFGKFQEAEFQEKCRLAGAEKLLADEREPCRFQEVETAVCGEMQAEELRMSCRAGKLLGLAGQAYEKGKGKWVV